MSQPDGTLEQVDGRVVLRFERHFAHPVERVWEAVTDPRQIEQWLGECEVELDLVPGGRITVRHTGPPELLEAMVTEGGADPDALDAHDTVVRVEPPHLFEQTFGGDPSSIVRWELEPDGDGCRLTLTHTEPPGFDVSDGPRDLAGWHQLLELLAQVIDGQAAVWTMDSWERHRDRYAANLG